MTLEDLQLGGRILPMTRWGDDVMHARTRPVTVFDRDHQACPDVHQGGADPEKAEQ